MSEVAAIKTPEASPALTIQNVGYYPPHWKKKVPKRVRATRNVRSELPFGERTYARREIEYDVYVNSNGAVCAILPDGELLGLKPDEFKVVDWHDTYPLDPFNEACRDLPDGYEISIYLEKHCGYVTLKDPKGHPIEVCEDDVDMEGRVREALKLALKHFKGE